MDIQRYAPHYRGTPGRGWKSGRPLRRQDPTPGDIWGADWRPHEPPPSNTRRRWADPTYIKPEEGDTRMDVLGVSPNGMMKSNTGTPYEN